MKGDKTGLLLEAKKPLERTPHFFEPGVGECVNATGLSEFPVLIDAKSATLTKKRWWI